MLMFKWTLTAMPVSVCPAKCRVLPSATGSPSASWRRHALSTQQPSVTLGKNRRRPRTRRTRSFFSWAANNHCSALDSGGQKLDFQSIINVLLRQRYGGRFWRSKAWVRISHSLIAFFSNLKKTGLSSWSILEAKSLGSKPPPSNLFYFGRRSQGCKPRLCCRRLFCYLV